MRLADYPDQASFSTAIPVAADGAAMPAPAPFIRPELLDEAKILRRLGFGKPLISEMLLRATRNHTSLEAELLASGSACSATYHEALAEMLGLSFMPNIDPGRVIDMEGIDSQLLQPEMVRVTSQARPPVVAIVPAAARIGRLQDMLCRRPEMGGMMAATTPEAVRRAVWGAGSRRRLRDTVHRLFDTAPEFSARLTFWGRQGFYAGAGTCLTLVTIAFAPFVAVLALHLVLTAIFFAALAIRFTALFGGDARKAAPLAPPPALPCPVYSVFVALYREGAVAAQLVAMLDKLDWPHSRLDIKLICEADDAETLNVLRSLHLGAHYEIVEVPPGLPRTKPKALSYALWAARGEYLVIYDAEDRPHPRQLKEAWARFHSAPADLACLQAPLVISNARRSWISAMFSLEYAGLFRRILPLLAVNRLPMPLGGTSNHFRTDVLRRCGGWDPHNVTEDADLGLRLFRQGYACGTLNLPTLEDAPEDACTWLGQRTRWFKGWLQTWLVHMRQPTRLMREIGILPFLVFQVLIGGMLLSSLAHPLLIAYVAHVAWTMASDGPFMTSTVKLCLFTIDIVNIFCSYAVFITLGLAPMKMAERKAVGRRWPLVAGYWMMMSLAAWRAVAELHNKPFFWNKTEHRPATHDGTSAGAGRETQASHRPAGSAGTGPREGAPSG